jgi:4-hydroxybenzoate polyprenyltransferase
MKGILSFLQLVRWPNLVFIALTQVLFQYCILIPLLSQSSTPPVFNTIHLWLLILSSVFIAAGGYIINDYFDVNIDQVNKPEKLIIGKSIARRSAIIWHSVTSFIGVVIGFYVGWKMGIWWIGPANFLCTLLLFVYSTTFKKRFLSGNIIISILTAWSVGILGLASFYNVFYNPELYDGVNAARVFRFTILYAGFAFVISVIREAIKDMEDIEGDARYGCKTLPIVAGLNAAKTYSIVWLVVLIGTLAIVQVYALQFNWWLAVLYSSLFIIFPLVNLFFKLIKATNTQEFHKLSTMTKLIMLMGILSMVFFKIYL